MPRKRALPSVAQRVAMLEDCLAELLPVLHQQVCDSIPRLAKTPHEKWALFAGASFFYAVSHSIASFVTPAQWKRVEPSYRALLNDFATDFGDVQGEIAAMHQAVLARRGRNLETREQDDLAQDVIIQVGLWPLQRSLRWKQVPLKYTPVVAILGNLIWENGATWFDPDLDPTADPVNDEVGIQLAILRTLRRMTEDDEFGAGASGPA